MVLATAPEVGAALRAMAAVALGRGNYNNNNNNNNNNNPNNNNDNNNNNNNANNNTNINTNNDNSSRVARQVGRVPYEQIAGKTALFAILLIAIITNSDYY